MAPGATECSVTASVQKTLAGKGGVPCRNWADRQGPFLPSAPTGLRKSLVTIDKNVLWHLSPPRPRADRGDVCVECAHSGSRAALPSSRGMSMCACPCARHRCGPTLLCVCRCSYVRPVTFALCSEGQREQGPGHGPDSVPSCLRATCVWTALTEPPKQLHSQGSIDKKQEHEK